MILCFCSLLMNVCKYEVKAALTVYIDCTVVVSWAGLSWVIRGETLAQLKSTLTSSYCGDDIKDQWQGAGSCIIGQYIFYYGEVLNWYWMFSVGLHWLSALRVPADLPPPWNSFSSCCSLLSRPRPSSPCSHSLPPPCSTSTLGPVPFACRPTSTAKLWESRLKKI